MKKKLGIILVLLLVASLAVLTVGCKPKPEDPGPEVLPEEKPVTENLSQDIQKTTYVYDELLKEDPTTMLYTLTFDNNTYKLVANDGRGIVKSGEAGMSKEKEGKILFFEDDKFVEGTYDENKNAISAKLVDNKEMTFAVAPDNTDYVYLNYTGAFYGKKDNTEAMLFLDRFFEFFMYADGELTSGTYDIYGGETIKFSPASGDGFEGSIARGIVNKEFDLMSTKISVNVKTKTGVLNAVEFSYYTAPKTKQFEAPSGMSGNYVYSDLPADTFIIRGSDGLAKAFGTVVESGTDITLSYFARNFIDKSNYTVKGTFDATSINIDGKLPLLPPSGGITATSEGKGSYFVIPDMRYEQVSDIDDTVVDSTSFSVNGVVAVDGSKISGAEVYADGVKVATTDSNGSFKAENLVGAVNMSFAKAGMQFDFFTVTKNTGTMTVGGKVLEEELTTHFPTQSFDGGMPTIGTAKPLVLLIDFPDQARPRHVSNEQVEASIFDLRNPDSLSAYYYRSSYGQLTIDGTVLEWYRASKARSSYTPETLMKEALDYHIANGLDMSQHDADNNGEIDSLFVVWAGVLDMTSSHYGGAFRSSWWRDDKNTFGTKKVESYIFVPGTTVYSAVPPTVCSTTALIHETGHLLGLNDYYSYDQDERVRYGQSYSGGAPEGGLGTLDMMDSNVGEHNTFSKWLLGWIEPEFVTVDSLDQLDYAINSYTLRPMTENPDALFIELKNSGDTDRLRTELFIIESISRKNNGGTITKLSEPAVRILHVSAELAKEGESGTFRGYGFRYDNSYSDVKFISMIEADGQDSIKEYRGGEGAGKKEGYTQDDLFKAGDEITPDTYPNTNRYDEFGNASISTGLKIKIDSIDSNGVATIKLGYVAPIADMLKVESVTPQRYQTPAITSTNPVNPTRIAKEEKVFTFAFNKNIEWTSASAKEEIEVWSSRTQITTGFTVSITDNKLLVTFANNLQENKDYSIMIPKHTVKVVGGTEKLNHTHIANFVTSGGKFVPVESIRFDVPDGKMTVNRTNVSIDLAPRLVFAPSGATSKSVIWSSSDTSVAIVDDWGGKMTVVGFGTATITATWTNPLDSSTLTATMTIVADQNAVVDDKVEGEYAGTQQSGMGDIKYIFVLTETSDAEGTYELSMQSANGNVKMSEGTYTIVGGKINLERESDEWTTVGELDYDGTPGMQSITGTIQTAIGGTWTGTFEKQIK